MPWARAFTGCLVGAFVVACSARLAVKDGNDGGATAEGGLEASGSGSSSSSGSGSSSGSSSGSGGSSSGSSADASSDGTGSDSSPDGGTCTAANRQTCWIADDGSAQSQQTCIFTCCAMTYCAAGSTAYFAALAACVCTPSRCQSACSGVGDYCTSAPSVATPQCSSCLASNFAAGAPCDPTTGTIASTCAADPECSGYLSCSRGCQ